MYNVKFYFPDGRSCVDLQPPKNGAIACDNWEGGQFCQVQCKNGTEMSSVSLNKFYVCNRDGEWSAVLPNIKTCRRECRKVSNGQ